ncbi:Chromodomain-helicase-DNA-binding protein like [Quillaja saponaria]|uniref:Chromodomain-helicase-DNA-binding protein like n=1 Tax=Quillaja saponaria TaxID=32244 RepID=A0AAD7PQF3_QUISA|nr:Chromodomain-helicase-DNA-binding protein like [Quillaja saponaria]
MAVTCTSSTYIPIQKNGNFLKPVSKVLMPKHYPILLRKAPILKIRASIKNKIFEDQSQGVICYTDDSGEIICEGYDEGPRFQQQVSRPSCHPRDVEIMDLLLQKGWLQIVKGGEVNYADKGVSLQEDLNCNGFNSSFSEA